MEAEPFDILLIEDNEGDVLLIQECLTNTRVPVRLHVVEDGVQAMQFLRREEKYIDAPRPDLIVLDLNLPRKSGREVLAEIKADPVLENIPITVFTSSDVKDDMYNAYNQHVNAYINKPLKYEDFNRVVNSMVEFWLAVIESFKK